MFKEISPAQLKGNPFQMIGQDWMLITAEKEGKINTMTASWGGLGIMWGKNVAFIVIRPQRYTKEFVDAADSFSLSFYDDSFHKVLGYLGTVSGRDEDKVPKSGLTILHEDMIPYFSEANTVLFCKKLFKQQYEEKSFIDTKLPGIHYPEKDYHYLYIAEISKIFEKE
ncbi:flavin reductase [Anaerocolumna sp. MB42-C2]|uniref:flavin reductase n=1 Tax=Anaerocolumna sp. MB42-C2 TaxID=3070997 RepID=UPI0027E102D3|nr:flavin reductase [Anaerocolumna sp. MB42-C2]WMJ88691.1 flavin reductase family protein [Anaerocolumna sp. MB42-C2]